MDELIKHNNEIYVRASAVLSDQRLRVLKYGETFGIFDVHGDIMTAGVPTQGLYLGSTRYVSRMELRISGLRTTLLSSSITSDDMLFTADLSNPDITVQNSDLKVNHSSFHLFRSKFLTDNVCYEEVQITNFSEKNVSLPVSFLFATDFLDMFEIRGIARKGRGTILRPLIEESSAEFSYIGLDDRKRNCRISFYPTPFELSSSECKYLLPFKAAEKQQLHVVIECSEDRSPKKCPSAARIKNQITERYERRAQQGCAIYSSSERFGTWIHRSKSDIQLMTTQTPYGSYPYAGIPWFNTIFGRDGLITALQYLWVDPNLAKGVLTSLASLQARDDIAYEDAEPGKILHELRGGEMVTTGEVPFKRYYGSIDSTPLFIILAGRYFEMTADVVFLETLWPSILRALEWIDQYGDQDGDGFIEYLRRSTKGLRNQGWKDSDESVFDERGDLVDGPIALCEVQGYVYSAKVMAADIAGRIGEKELADRLRMEARTLRTNFSKSFWLPDRNYLALALDKNKSPSRVLSSNAGQCLYSEILSKEQALKMASKIFSPEMFSGWGVRTLAANEVRYNPMSYHNGSVWPHDNSLIAEGFARYAMKEEVLKIAEAMFDVSVNIDLFRLPELFCGFEKRQGQGPTLYPVACSPQAWAAGSVFLLLKACLGLKINGFDRCVSLEQPVLPYAIEEFAIRNLQVADARIDLLFRRHASEVSVYVERRVGKVDVAIFK